MNSLITSEILKKCHWWVHLDQKLNSILSVLIKKSINNESSQFILGLIEIKWIKLALSIKQLG